MTLCDDKGDKQVDVLVKTEDNKIPLKCVEKQFNFDDFLVRQHEKSKELKCCVKAAERKNRRCLNNTILSIIITLFLILFMNFMLDIRNTWYNDGYKDYDFDFY